MLLQAVLASHPKVFLQDRPEGGGTGEGDVASLILYSDYLKAGDLHVIHGPSVSQIRLPEDLRDSTSVDIFKRYLFSKAFK